VSSAAASRRRSLPKLKGRLLEGFLGRGVLRPILEAGVWNVIVNEPDRWSARSGARRVS